MFFFCNLPYPTDLYQIPYVSSFQANFIPGVLVHILSCCTMSKMYINYLVFINGKILWKFNSLQQIYIFLTSQTSLVSWYFDLSKSATDEEPYGCWLGWWYTLLLLFCYKNGEKLDHTVLECSFLSFLPSCLYLALNHRQAMQKNDLIILS